MPDRIQFRVYCNTLLKQWHNKHAIVLCPYSITLESICDYLSYLVTHSTNEKTFFTCVRLQTDLYNFIYKDFLETIVDNESRVEAMELTRYIMEIVEQFYDECRGTISLFASQQHYDEILVDMDDHSFFITLSKYPSWPQQPLVT